MSSRPLQIAWISGWGVDPASLRSLASGFRPEAQHSFHLPTAESAYLAASQDLVIAWSLGALRVLDASAGGVQFGSRVILLAPFIAFCSEHGLGGKCSLTHVRYLKRWVQRDPAAAVADFYIRAGLETPSAQELSVPLPVLLEGLDRLTVGPSPALREFARKGLPPNWQAWIGDADPLLDAQAVAIALNGCRVATRADHSLRSLLRFTEPL